jgi:hypothetical protein
MRIGRCRELQSALCRLNFESAIPSQLERPSRLDQGTNALLTSTTLLQIQRRELTFRARPIQALALVNAQTGQILVNITDGMVVDAAVMKQGDLLASFLNIRAVAQGSGTRSVKFILTIQSAKGPTIVDKSAPFTVCGDAKDPRSGQVVFKSCPQLKMDGTTYIVTAQPHWCRNARCGAGPVISRTFTLPAATAIAPMGLSPIVAPVMALPPMAPSPAAPSPEVNVPSRVSPLTLAPVRSPVEVAPIPKAPAIQPQTRTPVTKAPITTAPAARAPVFDPITKAPVAAPVFAPITKAPGAAPVFAPTVKAPVTAPVSAPVTNTPAAAPVKQAPVAPPYTCDSTKDTCRFKFDGECDAVVYCDANSDCFDCDPCQAYRFQGCTACAAAKEGCAWCDADASCLSPKTTVPNYLQCQASNYTRTCASSANRPFSDPLYGSMTWMYNLINVQNVWKSGISKSLC